MSIDAIWRIERARILAALVRLVRGVDRAEDLAHEALVAAMEHWPRTGVPENPGAWLMTTAKNRALDELRATRRHAELLDGVEPMARDQPHDLVHLVLIACHPVLGKDARVALTLRLLGGLTTDEIARAFLVPEPTIAQRIVRAKRTLTEARVPFELPEPAEIAVRLPAVLEVVYLVFNEGYAATRGDDLMRPALCDEALRLGRILVGLVPNEAEVHALVALMELTASRAPARIDAHGDPVLLLDQDRSRWDGLLRQRGLEALRRSESLHTPLGPYALQAAIAACHARALVASDTDWPRIVALYDALVELTGSPVVELNRAVAVGMAFGAEEALALVDELADDLAGYHLLPCVRADLLIKLGRNGEARCELERAAAMTTNERERALLIRRAAMT